MKFIDVLLVSFLVGSMCVRMFCAYADKKIDGALLFWSVSEILAFALLVSRL